MANIRHISEDMVRALGQQKEQLQRIDLTPWDLQFLPIGPIQRGLLFHKPNTLTGTSLIHHLKDSLSHTLDLFPVLSGRFFAVKYEDDNTTSFSIDCNNKGVLFIHALTDQISISHIIRSNKKNSENEKTLPTSESHDQIDNFDSFFPLNRVKNMEGDVKPLLGVQITELADGVFIACTMNHAVGDGTSFWHFFNTWSEICRSEISRGNNISTAVSSKPPNFQRSFLNDYGVEFPIRIPNFELEEVHKESYPDSYPYSLTSKLFRFSKEIIVNLKASANTQVGSDQISSLQAILSHIFTSVYRTQVLPDPNQEIFQAITVGARPRAKFLPRSYFGNAVQLGLFVLTASELLDKGFGNVAFRLNRFISEHTEEEMVDYLVSFSKSPSLTTLGMISCIEGVQTIGSHRYDIYGNDFGWGKPIALRTGPGNKFKGTVLVLPGQEEGSIDTEISLLPETMDALVKDLDFMGVLITI